MLLDPHKPVIEKSTDVHLALARACEGFQSWDILDAAHMLVASLIVDLVDNNDRPTFLRKMDRVLRDRVKEIGGRTLVKTTPTLII
jgi:hypothetical protein